MAGADDYDVGYGRPPKHSRFRPGESGNPKGRRKGVRNLATDLAEELAEKIRIREGDRERSISKQRALLKAMVAKAVKGDTRAASLLIALIADQVSKASGEQVETPPSQSDMAIVEDFLRRHSASKTDASRPEDPSPMASSDEP